jgi:zinc transporter
MESSIVFAVDVTQDAEIVWLDAAQAIEPVPDGTWRWIHLDRSASGADDLLEALGFSPLAIRALNTEQTRPRSWHIDDSTMVVLRGVNLNPDVDQELISVRIAARDNLVVSSRRYRIMAVQDQREALAAGEGPRNSAELILAIIQGLSDRLSTREDELNEVLDRMEALDTLAPADQLELQGLRRRLNLMRRYLRPQYQAVNGLQQLDPEWFGADLRQQLGERSNEVLRLVEDLDLMEERAKLLYQQVRAESEAKQARNTYILSLVAAVFVPLSFITGLLGINVGGIPGAEASGAFTVVLLAMAGLIAVEVAIMKILKWF